MRDNNEELNEFVIKVRESSDIIAVISKYVPLKRRGNAYWGCCPFHSEKTPSFTVSPEKGFFYCFGCHAGGNLFKFISLAENISYFEAVKLQAERLGIPLPNSKKKKSPQEIKIEQERKLLIHINTLAKDFFHSCLVNTSYGEVGRKYLESRGISKETMEDFSLGFAPDSWDALSNALIKKKGIKSDQLVMAGLSSAHKNSSGVYDKFRNRVMIPIVDLFGNIVAFGGRIIDEKKNSEKVNGFVEPKYLNSPETLIFNKKKLLFGLNRATQEIRRRGFVIVVEGYMDVISVYSAGIKNIVASLGTAFSEEHAKLLLKYTRKILFCYDSDEAGQKATIRALSIVLNAGAEVKVIIIPDGKDPDEYIRKHGIEEFKTLIEKAMSIVEYRVRYVLSHVEHTTLEGKINALKQILPILLSIQDLAMRNEYRKRIAAALVIEDDVINAEMKKLSNNPDIPPPENTMKSISEFRQRDFENKALLIAGRIILKMAWFETDTLLYATSLVPKEAFLEIHQEIIDYLKECINQERHPDDITAVEELSEEAMAEVSKILLEDEVTSEEEKIQAYKESLHTMKLKWAKTRYAKITEEINDILTGDSDFTDNPEYIEKMKESLKIKREMDVLKLV